MSKMQLNLPDHGPRTAGNHTSPRVHGGHHDHNKDRDHTEEEDDKGLGGDLCGGLCGDHGMVLGDGHDVDLDEDLDRGLCDDPYDDHGEGLSKVLCMDPGTDPCGDFSGDLDRDRNRV